VNKERLKKLESVATELLPAIIFETI
jgi:hypothetical protein